MSETQISAQEVSKTTRKTISSVDFCQKLVAAQKAGATSRQFAISLYELEKDGKTPTEDEVKDAMLSVNSKRAAVTKKIREVKPDFSLPKLSQEARPSSGQALLDLFGTTSDETEDQKEEASA